MQLDRLLRGHLAVETACGGARQLLIAQAAESARRFLFSRAINRTWYHTVG
jgi:hypothetical protein